MKQQAVPLILIGILIAALLAFFAVIYSTPAPHRPPPARATPTPIPLTSVPGATNAGAINCYLARGETWTPIRYLAAADGRVYVLARTAGNCYGWMVDPD